MIRVGYFCTGGHTELGAKYVAPGDVELPAIQAFLQKISGDILWRRAFPAHQKPGPKPGRAHTRFKAPRDVEGVTGRTLVDRMRERLEKYYRGPACDIDVVVLVDDADCRFLEQGSLQRSTEDIERDVRTLTQRPELRFVALLASPEIEAWLLADWEEGFGREYRSIAVPLGRALQGDDLLGKRPWTSIESFGGPYANGSCTRKLSDEVGKVLERLAIEAMKKDGSIDPRQYTYKKAANGPDMLRKIRPERVAEVCRSVFAPALNELLDLALVAQAMRR